MRNKLITIFFCLLLAGASIISVVLPDKYYSESEKRKLTQKDEVKIAEYMEGNFQSNIDKYLTDQFPGRDGWISIKTVTDIVSGKRDSGGVYFGKDGYLIQKFSGIKTDNFKANAAAILTLQEQAKEQNVSFTVIPVPTAIEILSDKLPAFAPHLDQSKLIGYMKKQGLNVVDVTDTLKQHSNEYIYYRNDHHYTSLGAYYCYTAYRESLNLPVPPLDEYKSEVLCENFLGTSYAKVNYPFARPDTITAYYKNISRTVSYNNGDYVTDSIYERKYLDGKDQYAVFLNSNQGQTVIQGSGKGGKLLMIKDSYGNTFAQFPTEDYAEVHMLDLRFFRGNVNEYIKSTGITEVLVLYGIPNFANDVTIAA